MSFKFQDGIEAGSVDVSIPVLLRKTADSTEKTATAHTDVTASYYRQGGSRTGITMAALTNLTDAHADGGWKEVDATNMPGLNRFDVPDAAFALGADWVVISIKVATCFVFNQLFPLNKSGKIFGQFVTGTLAVDTASTNLTGLAADQVNRRLMKVLTGAAIGEKVIITDFVVASGVLKWAPSLTTAMANLDWFVIE